MHKQLKENTGFARTTSNAYHKHIFQINSTLLHRTLTQSIAKFDANIVRKDKYTQPARKNKIFAVFMTKVTCEY